MHKLIKSILSQLEIIHASKATSVAPFEKHSVELIKANSSGQWQILEKAYVNQPIPKGTCNCGAHKTGSEMHSDWCGGLKPAAAATGAQKTSPELDISKIDHSYKSLKDVHDKHGIDGVKKLIDDHGANGQPPEYSGSHFHINLHDDLNSITGNGEKNYGNIDPNHPSSGPSDPHNPRKSIYDNVRKNVDPATQADIDKTYNDMLAEDYNNPTPGLGSKHTDAVTKRALDHFKKIHNI